MTSLLSVRFYRTSSGNEPVRDWARQVSPKARQTIGADIKTVQYGWPIGMPIVRKMEPGLWEIRSSIPEGIARLLFTIAGTDMVLLHGFVKKTRATPKADLGLATTRLKQVRP